MKKFRIVALLLLLCGSALAQVDSSYIYNPTYFTDTNGNPKLLDVRIAQSSTRYWYLQNETFSYRGTNSYYITNPDAAWAKNFEQGHLRFRNGGFSNFVMNYRFAKPANYDANYEPGYPLVLIFHGAGERGNCWENNCYYSDPQWRPDPPSSVPPKENVWLLNNDHQLSTSGQSHWEAILKSQGRAPDDPSLDPRAFPGFVVMPQNLNGWNFTNVQDAIRIVRLMMKQFKIDPDRIYVHGLSNGGLGAHYAIKAAPWLFSAAASMSAIGDGGNTTTDAVILESLIPVPIWMFQGGKDTDPTPLRSTTYVANYRKAGLTIRYTEYANLSHNTWTTAYAEKDFFKWFTTRNKANISTPFGSNRICIDKAGNTQPVVLQLSKGFFAYEWEFNGEKISDAHLYKYTALSPGRYRARFSRVLNPKEDQWNQWSEPFDVIENVMAPPSIVPVTTTHSGLTIPVQNNNTIILRSSTNAESYAWFKNGIAIPNSNSREITLTPNIPIAGSGSITLQVSSGVCLSEKSEALPVFFSPGVSPATLSAPTELAGSGVSGHSILLRWRDNATGEKGYEVWRRRKGEINFNMISLTGQDVQALIDTANLLSGTVYEYKIRAVNATVRSLFAPAEDANTVMTASTLSPAQPIGPPGNLTVTQTTINSITLTWEAPPGDWPISSYEIAGLSAVRQVPGTQTSVVLEQLPPNSLYILTVRAVTTSGARSMMSNQVSAATSETGINYQYKTGAWESIKAIDWKDFEFSGHTPTISLDVRKQDDFFAIKFDGYIFIQNADTYTFELSSNDGSMLFLNGFNADDLTQFRVVDNDKTSITGERTSSGSVYLTAGAHRIVVLYFEYTGAQSLNVRYNGADTRGSLVALTEQVFASGIIKPRDVLPLPLNVDIKTPSFNKVIVNWSYSGSSTDEFEIYRSLKSIQRYQLISRTNQRSISDESVIAGTSYYYSLKAVNTKGEASAMTSPVLVTTPSDTQPPSTPQGLMLVESRLTGALIRWNPSTDNASGISYEVFIDNLPGVTTTEPVFVLEGLSPGKSYVITLLAKDASGNRSARSSPLSVSTLTPTYFYSRQSGNVNTLSTWNSSRDGTGQSPQSFSGSGQYFVIANRSFAAIDNSFAIEGDGARLLVPAGVTVDLNASFSGRVQVSDGGRVNVNNLLANPSFTDLSSGSTVAYANHQRIPSGTYGNLMLSGVDRVFLDTGDFVIQNDLTLDDGLKLSGGNNLQTQINLNGNLNIGSDVTFPGNDNQLTFNFTGKRSETIFSKSEITCHQISVSTGTTVLLSPENRSALVVGSVYGGGVQLQANSLLNIGASDLRIRYQGDFSAQNETAQLASQDGSLSISSASGRNYDIYFSANANTLRELMVDIPQSNEVYIHNAAQIKTGVGVESGQLRLNKDVKLLAGPQGAASIYELGSGAAIVGDVTIQHYVTPATLLTNYANSTRGADIASLQKYFPVNGNFVGASQAGSTASFFYYDDTKGGNQAYPTPPRNNKALLQIGVGYRSSFPVQPTTVEATGNPFQGDLSFDVAGTPTGSGRLNLVGNPYASAIRWNTKGWEREGIHPVTAVQINDQYFYWDYVSDVGSLPLGEIPSGQAFWIRGISSKPVLKIHEAAKSKPSNALLTVENPSSYAVLAVRQGDIADKAFVLLSAASRDNYEPAVDGIKLTNGIFNLSTLSSDNVSLAMNNIDQTFCSKDIRVKLDNFKPGTYRFEVDRKNLKNIGAMFLVDNLLKQIVEVTSFSTYEFKVTDQVTSYKGRFIISFWKKPVTTAPVLRPIDWCNTATATFQIENAQRDVVYYLLDVNNKHVSEPQSAFDKLTVNLTNLSTSSSFLRLAGKVEGCGEFIFPGGTGLLKNPFPPAPSVPAVIKACAGDAVVLSSATTTPQVEYIWFNAARQQIGKTSDGKFTSEPLLANQRFFVRSESNQGCLSDFQSIDVNVTSLPQPIIIRDNDVLSTENVAGTFQWYRDGVLLQGQNSNTLIVITDGKYEVKLTRDGCSVTSEPYPVLRTSTETTNENASVLKVYPNPSHNGDVRIAIAPYAGGGELLIVGERGELIKELSSMMAEDYQHEVHVQLTSGYYVIVYLRKGKIYSVRMVVL